MGRRVRMLWRTAPLLAKFIEVHFVGALMAIWVPLTAALILCSNMYSEQDIAQDQVVFNSMLAQYQRSIQPLMIACCLFAVLLATVYFNMMKHRVENNQSVMVKYSFFFWVRAEIEMMTMGWIAQVIFGSIPEWIAATRIVFQLKIDHAVAAMIGRPDMG